MAGDFLKLQFICELRSDTMAWVMARPAGAIDVNEYPGDAGLWRTIKFVGRFPL